MEFTNYIILILIAFGALIMLLSATTTKEVFNLLSDKKLKANWLKLYGLMLVFFVGYIAVIVLVILNISNFLVYITGAIFFMGALFVYIVVNTGLDSITKLKKVNQSLDDTEQKNKELEQFAYVTSHDLKTPLRGISSLASFIKQDLSTNNTEEVFNHVDLIQNQVERLEDLINGILNYSKIGEITFEEVNLNTILKQEFEIHKNSKKVKLITTGKLPIVQGDKIQLSQVFSNLIGNAIKYNDKDICEIYVSSNKKDNYHEIVFIDNGPGIDPKYHHKIFEVFQTLDTSHNEESTGIGLSIVKKVIENHQGKISVSSNGRKRTQFTILLPL